MKQVLFALLITLSILSVQAKSNGFSPMIAHLDIKDGLLNSFVTDITQDKHGFIWISTDAGLSRFDGENFKAFSEKNTPLCGNAINTLLYEPETDRLWIGTKKGLSVMDCATLGFETISLPEEYRNLNIYAMSRAKDKGIWIAGHYDVILHYRAGRFTAYTSKELPKLPMSFESITEGMDGNLYVGHSGYGLSIVNLKKKTVENYRSLPNDPKSLAGNKVKTVFIDRYRNIWVGTDKGLNLFNPTTKDFSRFTHDAVYVIDELSDGMIWIGTEAEGVSMIDIQNLTFSNPDKLHVMRIPVSTDAHGTASNSIRSIFQDSFGNIWIGNYGEGIDYISSIQPLFKVLPSLDKVAGSKEAVHSMYSDTDGNLWIGGKDYVACLKDGVARRRYQLSGNTSGHVVALARTGGYILASVQRQGIKRINIATGSVESLQTNTKYAECFYTASDGRVLAGAIDGLYEYKDGKLRKNERISSQINNLTVFGISVDKQHKLWIGTYGDGVYVFDKNGKLVSHLYSERGFASNAIKHIYRDSRGWMWIAGQDGLSMVKDTSRPTKYINYGYSSGLDDIHIRAITEDKSGNLWFSSNNELIKWDKKSHEVANYDYQNGLPQSNFIDRVAACDANGNVYFGSLKGVCSFNPDELQGHDEIIPISIVECQNVINPEEITFVYDSTHSEVKVPYDYNSVRITFSVPDISKSRLVEYSYKIEGIDNEWIMAGKEHSATLWNLAPGTYNFKVRVRFRNQEWNDANVASIKITVTPPLWLTWYAKLFYFLLFVGVAYGIIKYYQHRLLLKNALELERKKSIDEQHLNNERLRFYTNITHELRTPLTLILGPLEDLASDTGFPKNYQSKLKTIHESALRLLNLINQILEFRKTETQNRKLQVSYGNLSKVVTEIGLRYRELNRNRKVDIKLDIADDIADVYFDKDIIYTILNNLLSNAVKYTQEGEITLSLQRGGAMARNTTT